MFISMIFLWISNELSMMGWDSNPRFLICYFHGTLKCIFEFFWEGFFKRWEVVCPQVWLSSWGGVWKWVQASYWNGDGENIASSPPLKRKPCCLVVSLGNGSHRLLLYLTASRLALQPSLFFMAVAAVAGVAAASQNASGNRSSVGNKPLANGTLHTPMV